MAGRPHSEVPEWVRHSMNTRGLLSAIDRAAGVLPRRLIHRAGAWIADGIWATDRLDRLSYERNLQLALGLSRSAARRESRRAYRLFARGLIDTARARRMAPIDRLDLFSVHRGQRFLRESTDRGAGVVLLLAHVGFWELGGLGLSALGYPIRVVAAPERDPELQRARREWRRSGGVGQVVARESPMSGLTMLNALRSGTMLAFQGDRWFAGPWAEKMFFGRPARFPTGPLIFAAHARVPVVPTFVIAVDDETYGSFALPPLWPTPGSSAIEDTLNDVIRLFESVISTHPDQWFNFYDIWAGSGQEP